MNEYGQVSQPDLPFFVAGVGASAGGVASLEAFVQNISFKSGVAYVIIQHLSPDFKTFMDEILRRYTNIEVNIVQETTPIEANKIYLIPPKKIMRLEKGLLKLIDKGSGSLSYPIDIFFDSLALSQGDHAIAVVFSGTGSDGSHGAVAVAKHNGFVIAQDPDTAAFSSMPEHLINTGICHLILNPDTVPGVIEEYIQDPVMYKKSIKERDTQLDYQNYDSLENIFSILYKKFNVDFANYKKNSINRRIKQNIENLNLKDIHSYISLLKENDELKVKLFFSLLLGMTSFFRDTKVFSYIEANIIPYVVNRGKEKGMLRIWIPACSTGEEAYSYALLIHEYLEDKGIQLDVKIFATDLNEKSIAIARNGLYHEDKVNDISSHRLSRYFEYNDGYYKVKSNLRKLITFTHHDLLKNPPFKDLDLISCRNFLIYLTSGAQTVVGYSFNYGLAFGGILVLGSSEDLGDYSDYYDSYSRPLRIFKKVKEASKKIVTDSNIISTHRRIHPSVNEKKDVLIRKELLLDYDNLLDIYMPAGILLDYDYNPLHFFGDIDDFLQIQKGRTHNSEVFNYVKEEFRISLKVSLDKCKKDKKVIVLGDLSYESDNKLNIINITIRPIVKKDLPTSFFLEFKKISSPESNVRTSIVDNKTKIVTINQDSQIELLESELRLTKENLSTTVEELQNSNEELQSTNEELLSSNEELQTTNEELHSVNEELHTVNEEYDEKNYKLQMLYSEQEGLLSNLDIGVIYLDENLLVKKFNKASEISFHLMDYDMGRPIDHIAYQLDDDNTEFKNRLRRTLEKGEIFESEITTKDGQSYLKKIMPYYDEEREITNGVIVTLTNITKVLQAKNKLSMQKILYETILEQTMAGYWDWKIQENSEYLSPALKKMFGYKDEELKNAPDTWLGLIHKDDRVKVKESLDTYIMNKGRGPFSYRIRFIHKTGAIIWVLTTGRAMEWDEKGNPTRIIGAHVNITDIKNAELEIERQAKMLAEAQRIAKVGYWDTNFSTNKVSWTKDIYDMFLLDPSQPAPDYNFQRSLFSSESWDLYTCAMKKTEEEALSFELELQIIRSNDSKAWMLVRGEATYDNKGNISGAQGITLDISERKNAEEHLAETLKELEIQKNAACEESLVNLDLLDEVNHRVKNNLIRILGTFQLKLNEYTPQNNEYSILKDMSMRINSMLELHSLLSNSRWQPLEIGHLIDRIMSSCVEIAVRPDKINSTVLFKPQELRSFCFTPQQATSISLILSELVMNSTKYAFPNKEEGDISVLITGKVSDRGKKIVFKYKDNGVGWPEDVLSLTRKGLGLKLIQDSFRSFPENNYKLYNDDGAIFQFTLVLY
ncbi:CheR family methyltransferase [Spirochaeta cellobiosiphila]|uniref:CheR family methyltransferase n=1 Tax=Spirochaeta cellobiosiphila TaxID=504483 RepID=UPI0003FB9DEE|nr:CheR family methyltransferase [Spirochaeta cellobiosiphila]